MYIPFRNTALWKFTDMSVLYFISLFEPDDSLYLLIFNSILYFNLLAQQLQEPNTESAQTINV
jgi:hypothetical protein